jgi:regulator of CtrA degradation
MPHQLDRRLIDGLYVDAMVLADEARSYFDYRSDEHREALDRIARVEFACESLKVTTRLMHVIAWLLTQRAILNGELEESVRETENYKLGPAAITPPEASMRFGEEMVELISASEDLYDRVARLERQLLARGAGFRPVVMSQGSPHDLLSRLERAF